MRSARSGDARAIAAVHVASWQAVYRGLLPDGYLAALSLEERMGLWSGILADPGPGGVVVLELDSRVVGFAHVGPSGDHDASPATGEVYTIYLHPDAWDGGHGRRLMDASLELLVRDGYRTATLWMLSTNDRARRFYLRQGWSMVTGERSQEFGGQMVIDHRFGRPLTGAGPPRRQIFSRPSQ